MNDKWRETCRNMLKIGTPECAIFCGLAAMVLALLFLTIGFWRTVLVAVLVMIGAFLGGVRNKRDWLRGVINKMFPPKQNLPYHDKSEENAGQPRDASAPKDE